MAYIEATNKWIKTLTSINFNDFDGSGSRSSNAAFLAAMVTNVKFPAVLARDASVASINAIQSYAINIFEDNSDVRNTVYVEKQWSKNKLKEIIYPYLDDFRKELIIIIKHLTIPDLSDIIVRYVI